ncbi:MAG: hypothetical protein JNJ71_19520 [Rubrivivax sp.]|nr:hypothetical protein [Rubrivivax sp.]
MMIARLLSRLLSQLNLTPALPVPLKVVEGRAKAVQLWSDTKVSSHGGGGYVDPKYGGFVSAATVTSQSVQRSQFWVEEADGQQHCVQMEGAVLPVHAGQPVRLLQDPSIANPSQRTLCALNLHTGEAVLTQSADSSRDWARRHGLLRLPALYKLMLMGIGAAGAVAQLWDIISRPYGHAGSFEALAVAATTGLLLATAAFLVGHFTVMGWWLMAKLYRAQDQLLAIVFEPGSLGHGGAQTQTQAARQVSSSGVGGEYAARREVHG